MGIWTGLRIARSRIKRVSFHREWLRNIRAIYLCVVLAVISPAILSAQTCQPGELRILVEDSDQSPVLDAELRIAAEGSPSALRVTRTLGTADVESVPCGMLTVTAAKEGFETATKTIQITSAANLNVILILNPKAQHISVDVTDTAPLVEQTATVSSDLQAPEVKILPSNPATVTDALPLVPEIVRSPQGELKIDGTGEHRAALVVNQSDVTDPATGKFGQTIPVDSIQSVNVLNTPFLAQYGRFTSGVVAVETKRGGEKWHAELNDPFPDFRVRSWHVRGLRNETPRAVLGGPLIHDRLYINSALQYFFEKTPNRTLPFPFNESKREWINSFTQLDWVITTTQLITATLHVSPQHTNFVNPDFFNPQPSTPSYAQHNYVGTLSHHFGLAGGLLDSSISLQRFDAWIGAQGSADMILSPLGNSGNYFGAQNRSARRTEWLETWAPSPKRFFGNHLIKVGESLTGSGDDGQFTYRPVNIVNAQSVLTETIGFTDRNPFSRTDLEVVGFGQDHWVLSPKLALDYGFRIEHQRLAENLRIAPRAGFAWTPFPDQKTVLRAGYGQFYDHVPLAVYTFSRYPARTVTYYAPDGTVIGSPVDFTNVIGTIRGPSSFFVKGEQVAGAFAPRGLTWNAQIEHSFSRLLRVRAVYTDNKSVGLLALDPISSDALNEIVLNGDGSSHFRQAEVTAKFSWEDGQQLVMTYSRSRAQGTLNTFDTFLGNFPVAPIRPDVYSNLTGDIPNRILVWGQVNPHVWSLHLLPIIEYRSGFPYAKLDAAQNYVGVPNVDSSRYPAFFSADTRIMRDFQIHPKYKLRLSLSAFNITNHFNALAVHSNIADPQYGVFFGNYHRWYRGDFEVIF